MYPPSCMCVQTSLKPMLWHAGSSWHLQGLSPTWLSRLRSFKASFASLASSGGSGSPPSSPTHGSQLPPALPRCAYILSPVRSEPP